MISIRVITANLAVFSLITLGIELFSGSILNEKKLSGSSTLYAASALKARIAGKDLHSSPRLKRIQDLIDGGVDSVYPYYLYDPQAHHAKNAYWLTMPANSKIVYCDEGSGLLTYQSNSLGLRKTHNENLESPLELIILGDSYAEGACVPSPHDVPSSLSKKTGLNTLNLGRGGSGPLLQQALLSELLYESTLGKLKIKKGAIIVWIHFLGNDLQNLAEERSTTLSSYLIDPSFNSGYFSRLKKNEFKIEQDLFYREIISNPAANRLLSNHGYGESASLKNSFARKSALQDYSKTISMVHALTEDYGLRLIIISLSNHKRYDETLMRETLAELERTCTNNNLECHNYNMQGLHLPNGHFDAAGYAKLSTYIKGKL